MAIISRLTRCCFRNYEHNPFHLSFLAPPPLAVVYCSLCILQSPPNWLTPDMKPPYPALSILDPTCLYTRKDNKSNQRKPFTPSLPPPHRFKPYFPGPRSQSCYEDGGGGAALQVRPRIPHGLSPGIKASILAWRSLNTHSLLFGCIDSTGICS